MANYDTAVMIYILWKTPQLLRPPPPPPKVPTKIAFRNNKVYTGKYEIRKQIQPNLPLNIQLRK